MVTASHLAFICLGDGPLIGRNRRAALAGYRGPSVEACSLQPSLSGGVHCCVMVTRHIPSCAPERGPIRLWQVFLTESAHPPRGVLNGCAGCFGEAGAVPDSDINGHEAGDPHATTVCVRVGVNQHVQCTPLADDELSPVAEYQPVF